MKLISLYTNLSKVGGAENMCFSIHFGLLKTDFFSSHLIVSNTEYENLAEVYRKQASASNYEKFNLLNLIRKYPDAVLISHHRRLTSQLWTLSKLLGKKIKLIHIAHITLENHKYLSLFPDTNIAVSQKVADNLRDYFDVKNSKVIYNGIADREAKPIENFDANNIIISLPATINERKQQLKIAKFLKGKLPSNIVLQFAGDGPDLETLKEIIQDEPQMKALGYVVETKNLYEESDFILLFSQSEGLPLSLIESLNYGKPIICNDVGGALEILEPNQNGYFIQDLEDMLRLFQSLENLSLEEYKRMSMASKRIFKEKFRYQIMIDSYLETIKELCQK